MDALAVAPGVASMRNATTAPQQTVEEVWNGFFLANSAFVSLACLLLVWISWRSHRRHRSALLPLWIGSWSCYLVARVVTVLQIGHPGGVGPFAGSPVASMAASALSQCLYYLHVVLMVVGVLCVVDGERWRPRLRTLVWTVCGLVVMTGLLVYATREASLGARMFWRVGLRCTITAVVCTFAGWRLFGYGRRTHRLGAQLVAVALLTGGALFGMHAYAFTIGRYTEVAYLGGLEVLVVCAIGLGLVLWLEEGLHAEAKHASHEIVSRAQAMLQAQRMESVGQLAGGVAHDFNNVLTVVLGNSEELLRRPDLPPAIRQGLEESRHAALHAARLTSQLLTMARHPGTNLRCFELNREVTTLLPLLRNLVGVGNELRVDLCAGPVHVTLMRGHLEQILTNLVVNARDAIQGTGHVTLVTRLEQVDGRSDAVLQVRDSGAGMPESVRARVGELFFTTKGTHGTGLGMATVRSILVDTSGTLSIESAPGAGTTIRIAWPATSPSKAAPTTPPDFLLARPVAATILLVEDEPMVRTVTTRVLEAAGHRVLAPATSVDAAAMLREPATAIDLMVTDIVMPEWTGPQLAELARAVRPRLPIRFVSGFVDADLQQKLPPDIPVLLKPFTRQELLGYVAAALQVRPSHPAPAAASHSRERT